MVVPDAALRSALIRSFQCARGQDLWLVALVAVVVGYAGIAALHPRTADDTFFLLNDAKWLVEHGEVPWVDHFSYTAQGRPWI
jgi:hypothetical protein